MCKVTSKALMGIMTIVFWGAAAGLIFVGAWVFKEYQHYEQLVQAKYTLIPAAILMGVGFFFFILGLIGCVGAFKEHRCLLAAFFTILLVILVATIVAPALGYVYRADIDASVRNGIKKGLKDYNGNNTVLREEVDFMQRELHCCGGDNYTDWVNTPWYRAHDNLTVPFPESCCQTLPCTNNTNVFKKLKCCGIYNYTDWSDTEWAKEHPDRPLLVPDSCCVSQNCTFSPAGNGTKSDIFYARGCYTYLKDEFLGHLGIIVGVGAAFCILQVFGMIAACGLFCRRRPTNTYIGLTSPEHMRV